MPVHVPPGPDVAQEARALGRVEPLPQRRRRDAQRADDLAPVAAVLGARRGVRAHEPDVASDRVRRLVEARGPGVRGGVAPCPDVVAGQQPVARDREERKANAARGEVERDVHHRQPRAEHQHRFALADDVERSADPGVADVAVRVVELAPPTAAGFAGE